MPSDLARLLALADETLLVEPKNWRSSACYMCSKQAVELAKLTIALLAVDKPCSWDANDVCTAVPGEVRVHEASYTNADELRWAIGVLLRSVETMEAKEQSK